MITARLVFLIAVFSLVGCAVTESNSDSSQHLVITKFRTSLSSPSSPSGWIYAFDHCDDSRNLCVFVWPDSTWTLGGEIDPGHYGDELARGQIDAETGVALGFPVSRLETARTLYTAGGVTAMIDDVIIQNDR